MTPWTVACQASLSIEFLQARILEWVAIPFPWDLSDPQIEPASPAMQADSLLSEPPGKLVAGTIVLPKCLAGTCGNGREALMDAARLNLHISLERH